MTALCIGIIATWIIASTLLVYAICVNSGRMSQEEDKNNDYPEYY